MAKFLDYSIGLPALWAKIKGLIPTKTSELTNDSGFVQGVFYVTMTSSTVDGETVYTANESFDNAYAAYVAGRTVKLKDYANTIHDLTVATQGGMVFKGNTASAIMRWTWVKSTNKLTKNETTSIASQDDITSAINNIPQSNWEQDDTTSSAHILNRPSIRTSEGENSVVEGGIENDDEYAVYTLTISGDAHATVYTYTTEDTLPSSSFLKLGNYIYYEAGTLDMYKTAKLVELYTENNTIELSNTLSSTALTNATVLLYYKSKNVAFGKNSHSEGYRTVAAGNYSHAEGNATFAKAVNSHAEGLRTHAIGSYSHAEGGNTVANGAASHAEGSSTIASGFYSHSEGYYTVANHKSQHVFGEYNTEDPSTAVAANHGNYVEIVGNGTSSARSNARTLDWSGNEVLAGKLTVGAAPTNEMDVATKGYVDSATSGITTNLVNLEDVDVTGGLSHDMTLRYDNPTSTWIPSNDYIYGTVKISGTTATFTSSITPAIVYKHHSNVTYHIVNSSNGDIYRLFAYEKDSDAVWASFVHIGINSVKIISTTWADKGSTKAWSGTVTSKTLGNTTYSLSLSGSTITLTGSDSSTSSVTLPIYNGGVQTV